MHEYFYVFLSFSSENHVGKAIIRHVGRSGRLYPCIRMKSFEKALLANGDTGIYIDILILGNKDRREIILCSPNVQDFPALITLPDSSNH
ncbi:hypothetical protein [Xenorhabdus doucetiae]|uniref:hypothetical protein n=1 Tax=Xenorhabdus doucetiae TaxID=351671 RepID=UPI0011E66685|nr:hypothetical protein [Xenorhabdus doucetiae]